MRTQLSNMFVSGTMKAVPRLDLGKAADLNAISLFIGVANVSSWP
jgi:hypothetical protein